MDWWCKGNCRASPDIATSNTYRQLAEVTKRSLGNVSIILKLKPNWLVSENLEEVNLMSGRGLRGTAVKRGYYLHMRIRLPINIEANYSIVYMDNLQICVGKHPQIIWCQNTGWESVEKVSNELRQLSLKQLLAHCVRKQVSHLTHRSLIIEDRAHLSHQ